MVILNLELDNIYSFKDFKINFSYPKKVVKTTIEGEYLKDRPNFRYKKAVILMGANATGKTTIGRALLRIFKFIEMGDPAFILSMVGDLNKPASLSMDFVNGDNILNRIVVRIIPYDTKFELRRFDFVLSQAVIGVRDTYEKAVSNLHIVKQNKELLLSDFFKSSFGNINYTFALTDESDTSHDTSNINQALFLEVLKAILKTLDPSLTDISVLKGVEDSYVIRRGTQEIILQKGKLTNQSLLSSGTIKGIDIAIMVASIIANKNGFYYCDEHFSYIQTDLEKRLFGIMLEHLDENEQLIFTTHNSDMLDLSIPKHTYAFLKKDKYDDCKISVMYASDILKRNTDSVRSAAENDVFSSIPDDTLLNKLDEIND